MVFKTAEDRKAAFGRVFGSEEGQMVLEEIRRLGGVDALLYFRSESRNAALDMVHLEGQRNLAIKIINLAEEKKSA